MDIFVLKSFWNAVTVIVARASNYKTQKNVTFINTPCSTTQHSTQLSKAHFLMQKTNKLLQDETIRNLDEIE